MTASTLAGFSAQKCADERSLAGRAGSEDDDVELATVLTGPERGELLIQAGSGRLILDLTDDALGLAGLNRCGLDDVGGRLDGAACRRPSAPERSAHPEDGKSQEQDQHDQEGDAELAGLSREAVMQLGERANQPGGHAEQHDRGGETDQ